jgi:glutamate/tyrosine decarboxylase-like PLP-dependent enzyme
MTSKLLEKLFNLVERYREDISNPSHVVVDYKTPSELSDLIRFAIDEHGVSADEFAELMENYLNYSVHTGNRHFHNQLFSGFNFPAFAGDVLSTLTNTSMYTYEAAPVATLIEREIINTMNGYIGYEDGDGIFLTGGSNANLIAMFSARTRMFPDSRFDGLNASGRLTAFVSVHAHYSFENAANLLGIGAHNVIKVAADENGRMIPAELDKAIQSSLERQQIPFFVGATSGTTVMAAFDPLESIADICRKYKLWFHADGAFGSSLILSPKYQHLFRGSQLTDSFCWDAHKLMGIPLISSALLVKSKGTLQFNLSDINTDYIYHNNSEIEDLGKKSVQCGRKVDAVKLWFAWKHYGKSGYAEKMEHLVELAKYAEDIVHRHDKLELVVPRQTLTVCFRYIPSFDTNVDKFNFTVREELRKSGKTMVNVARLNNQMFIRLIISNFENQQADVDQFFDYFIQTARELEQQEMLQHQNHA